MAGSILLTRFPTSLSHAYPSTHARALAATCPLHSASGAPGLRVRLSVAVQLLPPDLRDWSREAGVRGGGGGKSRGCAPADRTPDSLRSCQRVARCPCPGLCLLLLLRQQQLRHLVRRLFLVPRTPALLLLTRRQQQAKRSPRQQQQKQKQQETLGAGW